MSIATAITDFKNRISAIYDILEQNNAEMPEKKDTINLSSTIETVQTSLDTNEEYTMIKYSNDVKSFYLIEGELSSDSIPGLSDAIEVKLGIQVVSIADNIFSDCASLTSVTIHNKTWQDAIDNNYWGISDPNIMHGDWDKYLSFTNAQTGASTVKLQANGSAPEISLLSSSGADDWQSYDLTSDIELAAKGDRVFLKAGKPDDESFVNERFGSSTNDFWKFVMTGKIAANGSIMSLLDGKNDLTEISASYCFNKLFYYCTQLIKAPLLPAIKLSEYCYSNMFINCSQLVQMPNLPAMSLGNACYQAMFQNCSNLSVVMKKLPATELKQNCYANMFAVCSKLSVAPELPATTLAIYCYENMFKKCYLLNNVNVAFTEWKPTSATGDWLVDAGTSVPETTFICNNQLNVSTRSNNTIPADTETHIWNIQPTLDQMMTMLEDYPKFKDQLPAVSSNIFVDYILNDNASDNTVCNTRALVEEKQDMLSTINTPWTILGYNKTIPQYVKYRRKKFNGTYDYLYVSSVDDTTVKATVDGVKQTISIKHGFENAQLIDENDQTGLLRPIAAGCKTYVRAPGGFARTDTFTETKFTVESVSPEIARNIVAKDGSTHTYGNNNPYDCPTSIVVGGKKYRFCGYTVTVQSANLLTDMFNGTYTDTIVFDAGEDKYAVAVNKYEAGKTYCKRSGLSFTTMSPTAGAAIDEEEVYEYDFAAKTMTCKSAYVQDFYEYGTELSGVASEGTEHLAGTVPAVGTLITSDSLSVENNNYWDTSGKRYSNVYGCNKWCQSNVRTFMNFEEGKSDYAAAFVKKNPFDKNSTAGLASGNSYMLKLSKDADFLKYVAPAVNRNAVPDKHYNTAGANARFRGSFVAYKEEEKASITGSKVNVSHDVDKFFLISYTEVGFTTDSANFDKLDATSDFTDVYLTRNNATSNETRKKYKYLASGELDASSAIWWLRSPSCSHPQIVAIVYTAGDYNSYNACTSSRLSPACTLY